jgi:hypothetical protein
MTGYFSFKDTFENGEAVVEVTIMEKEGRISVLGLYLTTIHMLEGVSRVQAYRLLTGRYANLVRIGESRLVGEFGRGGRWSRVITSPAIATASFAANSGLVALVLVPAKANQQVFEVPVN